MCHGNVVHHTTANFANSILGRIDKFIEESNFLVNEIRWILELLLSDRVNLFWPQRGVRKYKNY